MKPVRPPPVHSASRGARRALPAPPPSELARRRPDAGGLVDAHRGLRRASTAETRPIVAASRSLARHGAVYCTASAPISVGVIGGGISGVTAARALAEAGVSVVVHERSAILGGRLGAVEFEGEFVGAEPTIAALPRRPGKRTPGADLERGRVAPPSPAQARGEQNL